VARVIGGESGVVREHQQVLAHLMEGSRGRIGARGCSSMGKQGAAAEVIDGEGVLAMDWWRGVVGELHGVKAKLIEVLGWLGWLCSDGSTDEGVRRRRERSGGSYAGDRAWLGSL